ncbi:MAG: hypothetical protein QXQ46_04395 [Thermoplasmatales archaeon]
MKEDIRNSIMTLFDGAFDRGVKIPKTDKNGKVIGYDLYGPKIVVDPYGMLSKYSTASRTFLVVLVNKPGFQSSADDIVIVDAGLI